MIPPQQMLTLFQDIQAFLLPQVSNKKCILVVGARSSGKTSLIKYFSGVAFTRDTNEEDLPFLVENTEIPPQSQTKIFAKQKITLELTLLKSYDAYSEEVTIVEMPSFASLTSQAQQQEQQAGLTTFNQIIYGLYIWNTVLNLAKQIHIFLVTPYEFITDDHKLIEFFSIWEKCLIQNQQYRTQIKQCLTIIFTKPEYEDDKQALITSLDHLSHSGSEQIGLNNSFLNATQTSRVFCFLSQDTQEGQGPQLLRSIMEQADFYLSSQNDLFADDWCVNFGWSLLKQGGDNRLKHVLRLVEKVYKELVQSQQKSEREWQKKLQILGDIFLGGLTKQLSKQNQLKKKQKQLQTKIKEETQNDQILKNKNIHKMITEKKGQNNNNGVLKYIEAFYGFHQIITNLNNQSLILSALEAKVINYFSHLFPKQIEIKEACHKFISQALFKYQYPSIFYQLCQSHKDNIEIQHQVQSIDDINKDLIHKLASHLKNSIINGCNHYSLFHHLSGISSLAGNPMLKQLMGVYGGGGEQDEEEEQVTNTDKRIKRIFEKSEDMYSSIRERCKKVVIKPSAKQEVNERQELKILFSLIERQQQNRKQNLAKLAKKLIDFNFYQYALETYMDLADPLLLYSFITDSYTANKLKDIHFLKSTLIPYLEEKASITTLYLHTNAEYFLYAAQFCYDYLSVNFATTAQEYEQIAVISNDIDISSAEFEEEDLNGVEIPLSCFPQQANKDMQFLKYISFLKAQIIQKINERDQKSKKNGAAFNQIRKLLQAPKIEVKVK